MSNPQLPPVAPSSPRQMLRSVLIALAVALLLLFTVVLPAEYGIDPTGVGRVLGLTRMGEIKVRLAKEAAADAAADAAAAAEDTATTTTQP
jgi:membrane protein required for beta-lactamase induction